MTNRQALRSASPEAPAPAPVSAAAPGRAAATDSGILLQPVYTGAPDGRDTSLPGEPPYTRGAYRTMYRGRGWTVRQLAGYGTADDTNRRLRLLLAEGAAAVNTVFDYPTNRGYDSDDPLAAADAGQGGVAIDSVDDMHRLYAGIDLDEVSVSLVLSHPIAAGTVLAMYLVAAEERGHRTEGLRGTLQNDFMMETAVLTAPHVLPPSASFRLGVDVVEYCAQHLPHWYPVSFAGYNYREAGADAILEVALVVANAVATIEEMRRRGHGVDSFAHRLSSFFTAGNDLFEEVAKFRAARRVYHREVDSRFRPARPASARLKFHVQTSGSRLTAQQPLNNITRSTVHALAAVLGGAQSLHVSAYDEAVSIPSESAALTALRTQQILFAESGVSRTADPLAGSYLVEHLTDAVGARIAAVLAEIDGLGGLLPAVESGWVHRRLTDTAYRDSLDVESGRRQVVGVNCHVSEPHRPVAPFTAPRAARSQGERLARLRAARDEAAVRRRLAELADRARSRTNTMPALVKAVAARCTLGECTQVLRDVFGNWQQPLG
ncbi:methylmalonyl-CoA mutase [Streptomyces sp. AV19]|uniref:acyl-CoA mutase large subunit family protein n=1 Tax=Streptomyces sp. AV19 TaxID=2793068 RepID=UPI0018FE3429|nr:methylmalonyl-CoA mutase family protein [Streptomyces sp. AV19]MBH1937664.1 methylmalonyl-CoA mutase [Streptomyces sp. AV19]MDG4536331.1 methylmalonyl-CoA mutase family protein [Streptomyces sp. AV19]